MTFDPRAHLIQLPRKEKDKATGQWVTRLEAYLDGRLLIFRHHDVPGIIGAVGTIFGRHNVNIAQMAVGRDAPGGEAVGVLNLDTEPSAEALAEVRQLPAITSATVVRLPPAGQLPSWLQG